MHMQGAREGLDIKRNGHRSRGETVGDWGLFYGTAGLEFSRHFPLFCHSAVAIARGQ